MRSIVVASIFLLAACTRVDVTEHCVETRYGKVVSEKMDTGLNETALSEVTCFTLTEQNYPAEGVETVASQTRRDETGSQVTLTGDIAMTFAFDPATIFEVFNEKRTQEAALVEVHNSLREGYRNAIAGWTVAEVFSERRSELGDSIRAHTQRKIGNRAQIRQVFVRDIKIPPAIEAARNESAQQALVLTKARQQFVIDSVNAVGTLMKARAEADAKELTARAYEANPSLLELEVARAMAGMCNGTSTCVIGGSVMDSWQR